MISRTRSAANSRLGLRKSTKPGVPVFKMNQLSVNYDGEASARFGGKNCGGGYGTGAALICALQVDVPPRLVCRL